MCIYNYTCPYTSLAKVFLRPVSWWSLCTSFMFGEAFYLKLSVICGVKLHTIVALVHLPFFVAVKIVMC